MIVSCMGRDWQHHHQDLSSICAQLGRGVLPAVENVISTLDRTMGGARASGHRQAVAGAPGWAAGPTPGFSLALSLSGSPRTCPLLPLLVFCPCEGLAWSLPSQS